MIRTAKMADVDCVLKLINNYAEKGLMLPRSPFDIYRKLTSFVVYETDGKDNDTAEYGICVLCLDTVYKISTDTWPGEYRFCKDSTT